uniref:BCNT-C domain-containing protein n=1 Tax=Globisporangium ultimum (strain ATCC 200006 / CBS 805.95 / DAOM BR144) TaxID=431595 RepID=K3WLG7_GLOUD
MSSSDDDEDYVPEGGRNDDEIVDAGEAAQNDTARQTSVKEDARVNSMWADINTSTSVSQKAADKTAKYLKGLTSKKQPKPSKKRKLHEFQIPVLSVDVKKSRQGLIDAAAKSEQVDQVVKFAGVEYRYNTKSSVFVEIMAKYSQLCVFSWLCSVSKTVNPAAKASAKGIDQVLASLDAPKKVSTMEKTSMDWDKFKEVEGIEEELHQYTKDGYIEKQEFLQRVDLKQFEIEKAERDKKRALQQQQP